MSVDLARRYLGLELRSPLVPSASPLGQRVETLQALQDAGVGAVVLPSLFEEQIEHDEVQIHELYEHVAESHWEALSYFPEFEDYNTGADAYLRHVEGAQARARGPGDREPQRGLSPAGGSRTPKRIQEAGADALELNVYFIAADPDESADDVEMRYVELVEAVRTEISIPLAVKIGPHFSSIGHMAHRLVAAGADGLVLFNRFMQPDIDLETLTRRPGRASVDLGGAAAAAAMDRHPPRPRARLARADDRRATPPPTR